MKFILNIFLFLTSTNIAYATCFNYGDNKYDFPNANEPITQEVKIKYAESLLKYSEELNNQLPRLSPKEEEWLDKEIAGGNKRHFNAILSKEYKLQQVNIFLDNNIYFLEQIIKLMGTDLEIYYWSRIAGSLTFHNTTQDFGNLFEDNTLGNMSIENMDVVNIIQIYCMTHANIIIVRIIAPYLQLKQ